jgi:hypothetical protein
MKIQLLFALSFLLMSSSLLAASTQPPVANAKVSVFQEIEAAPLKFQIFLGPEARYERDSTQQLVFRSPFNFGLGLRKGRASLAAEYTKFTESSGNNTLSIDRTHEEYVLWGNYSFADFDIISFYASLGLGAYQESVTTILMGSSATDNGNMTFMGGTGVGGKLLLAQHFMISLEGRVLAGQNFDPNPQLGILLRFGAEF